MSHASNDDKSAIDTPVGARRQFFEWATRAIAAVIGLGLAVPMVGYIISPAFKRRALQWMEIGNIDELTVGEPKQLQHVMTVKDGWRETQAIKAVWAVKRDDGQVTVYSPLCPHLGCGYRWDESDRKFKCPCHGSVFSVTGQVLAGPAPRPLDVLPSTVENGKLLAIYKEFKAGLSKQVEL